MEKFKAFLNSEKKKLEGLAPKQKLEYILQYYWIWIVAVICLVAALAYGIYHAAFAVTDNWFYAMIANSTADVGNGSDLWNDFAEYSGYDLKEKNIIFNAAVYFDPTTTSGTVNSYYESFVAVDESGDLDVLIMPDEEELKAVGSSGRLLDLNSDACSAIRRKYGDRLVYCEPYDESYSDSEVPVGIDVSDSILMTRYGVYDEGQSCILGISAYTGHMDAIETFLSFILEDSME